MNLEDYIEADQSPPPYKKWLLIAIVLFCIWLVWYLFLSRIQLSHEIYMDSDKVTFDRLSMLDDSDSYQFKYGQDFFVFFQKGWQTPKNVTITIAKLEKDGKQTVILRQSRKFREQAEKMQMYFDEYFFDEPGQYEIIFIDEEKEVLASQKFILTKGD